MANINIRVTLDNIDPDADASVIADMIERVVKQQTGMEVSTTIYDNDGAEVRNPIFAHNILKKLGN